jgi:hypothetical protein
MSKSQDARNCFLLKFLMEKEKNSQTNFKFFTAKYVLREFHESHELKAIMMANFQRFKITLGGEKESAKSKHVVASCGREFKISLHVQA